MQKFATSSLFAFLAVLSWAILCPACDIPESERCAGDPTLEFRYGTCQKKLAAPTTSEDTSSEGLFAPCEVSDHCAGKAADFCVKNPSSTDPGYCSYQDCDVTTDSCPDSTRCCNFPDQLPVPNFCVKDTEYPMSGMCQEGAQ